MHSILDNATTFKTANGDRPPRRRRPRSRPDFRLAVRKGISAANYYFSTDGSTFAEAAKACDASLSYTLAAASVLKNLLEGDVPLAVAAAEAERRRRAGHLAVDDAVFAWRVWSAEERAEFGRAAGIAAIWDHAIVPVIGEARQKLSDNGVQHA